MTPTDLASLREKAEAAIRGRRLQLDEDLATLSKARRGRVLSEVHHLSMGASILRGTLMGALSRGAELSPECAEWLAADARRPIPDVDLIK